MPKPYVPTGRPPGRPAKSEVERHHIRDVVALLKERTVDRRTRPMNAYCPECYPDGFPQGIRQMVCTHGVWVKR
jgi:hypothetical protein